MDNPSYSAPDEASGRSARRRNAGSVTEKAAATTEYIRRRAGAFMGKVDSADRTLHDAENRLKQSEQYLEKVLSQMEDMVYAGRDMANQARQWLAEHPQYEEPVRNLSLRMAQLRDDMSEGMEDPGEYAREHPISMFAAGALLLGVVAAGVVLAQRSQA